MFSKYSLVFIHAVLVIYPAPCGILPLTLSHQSTGATAGVRPRSYPPRKPSSAPQCLGWIWTVSSGCAQKHIGNISKYGSKTFIMKCLKFSNKFLKLKYLVWTKLTLLVSSTVKSHWPTTHPCAYGNGRVKPWIYSEWQYFSIRLKLLINIHWQRGSKSSGFSLSIPTGLFVSLL